MKDEELAKRMKELKKAIKSGNKKRIDELTAVITNELERRRG